MSILYIIICINLFQNVFFQSCGVVSVWYLCGILSISTSLDGGILHFDICVVSGEVGGVVCDVVSGVVCGVVREFRRMRLV